jgi:hypothetical protein
VLQGEHFVERQDKDLRRCEMNNVPLSVIGEIAEPELVDEVVMKGSKRRAEGRVFEMTWQAGG